MKVLRGTDRPDRMRPEPEFAPVNSAVACPVKLINAEAEKEWRDSVAELTRAGVLRRTELKPLAHYCNLHGTIQDMWDRGEVPTGSLVTQLRMMWNEFGFTPASRSKAGSANDKPKTNPFEALRREAG